MDLIRLQHLWLITIIAGLPRSLLFARGRLLILNADLPNLSSEDLAEYMEQIITTVYKTVSSEELINSKHSTFANRQ